MKISNKVVADENADFKRKLKNAQENLGRIQEKISPFLDSEKNKRGHLEPEIWCDADETL